MRIYHERKNEHRTWCGTRIWRQTQFADTEHPCTCRNCLHSLKAAGDKLAEINLDIMRTPADILRLRIELLDGIAACAKTLVDIIDQPSLQGASNIPGAPEAFLALKQAINMQKHPKAGA